MSALGGLVVLLCAGVVPSLAEECGQPAPGGGEKPTEKVVGVYELPPVESLLVLSVGAAGTRPQDDGSSFVQARVWGHRMLCPREFIGGSLTVQPGPDTLEVFVGRGSHKTWGEESYASVAWEAEEASGDRLRVKRIHTTVQAPHTAESVGFTYVGFKAVEGGHLYPEIGWRNFRRDQHGDYGSLAGWDPYHYYPLADAGGAPEWSGGWSSFALVDDRLECEWGYASWPRWGSLRRAVISSTFSSSGFFKRINDSSVGVGWVF